MCRRRAYSFVISGCAVRFPFCDMVILAVSLWENTRHLFTSSSQWYFQIKFIKIFVLKQYLRKVGFPCPVIVIILSNIYGGFFPKFLFELMWIVNILILSLFSFWVINAIYFHCCCLKSSSGFFSLVQFFVMS